MNADIEMNVAEARLTRLLCVTRNYEHPQNRQVTRKYYQLLILEKKIKIGLAIVLEK